MYALHVVMIEIYLLLILDLLLARVQRAVDLLDGVGEVGDQFGLPHGGIQRGLLGTVKINGNLRWIILLITVTFST